MNSRASTGTRRSRTSQASMPPGLTTRSMVIAAAGATLASISSRRRMDRATKREIITGASGRKLRVGSAGRLGQQNAGDRTFRLQHIAGRALDIVLGDGFDALGPFLDIGDGLAGGERRADDTGAGRQRVLREDRGGA